MIGGLASSSYLFNWVWLQLVEAAVDLQTSDGKHPAAHVTRPGRTIPTQSLQDFSASLDGLMEHEPVFCPHSACGRTVVSSRTCAGFRMCVAVCRYG